MALGLCTSIAALPGGARKKERVFCWGMCCCGVAGIRGRNGCG